MGADVDDGVALTDPATEPEVLDAADRVQVDVQRDPLDRLVHSDVVPIFGDASSAFLFEEAGKARETHKRARRGRPRSGGGRAPRAGCRSSAVALSRLWAYFSRVYIRT